MGSGSVNRTQTSFLAWVQTQACLPAPNGNSTARCLCTGQHLPSSVFAVCPFLSGKTPRAGTLLTTRLLCLRRSLELSSCSTRVTESMHGGWHSNRGPVGMRQWVSSLIHRACDPLGSWVPLLSVRVMRLSLDSKSYHKEKAHQVQENAGMFPRAN